MKKITHKILRLCIKPFYGSGIGKYFPFNYIYKIHKYIGNSLFFKGTNEIIVKTNHGFGIYLKKGKFIDENIISHGEWEPNISNLIKNNLKTGNTFLDLGTNIGYFSLLASKIVGENGRVISFEPSKSIFNDFSRNIELNFINNIIKYNLGVGEENTKKELYYNESNPGGSSVINMNNGNNKETIEIVKLDDFLKDTKIDFIKMDIEGFEYFAIKGMINILKNNNIKMIFEYSPKFYEKLYGENHKNESINMLDELKKIGFNLYEVDYKGNLLEIFDSNIFFEKIYNGLGQIDIYCEK